MNEIEDMENQLSEAMGLELFDVRIVDEPGKKIAASVAIEGLPDVGLVGTIGTTQIVEQLELEEVAHVESDLLPNVMVLHRGVLADPVRIFGGKNLFVLTSEIAIPPLLLRRMARVLVSWFKSKGVKFLISIGGFPVATRLDIERPAVSGVGNGNDAIDSLKKNGIPVLEEGFVAGSYALLLKESGKENITGIALLAEAFLNYPDPGAAASVLESLSKILKIDLDSKVLMEKGDEIRVKARDLMKQAVGSMGGMGKLREQEIPLMYK